MTDFEKTYYRYSEIDLNELKKVTENYSVPVYVYSKSIVEKSFNELRKNLPSGFEVFYAQKSNPHPEFLKLICSMGAGCDTASLGEMRSALNAGFPAEKIMLTGPAKTENEIRFAVDNNLLSVNIESIQELFLVDKIAGESSKIQSILVRVNPPYDSSETTKIIGGTGVSKFGIDVEQISDFFDALKNARNVTLKGIHIFNSSQILGWERIYNNTKNVIETAADLSIRYGINVSVIDLGGGFGIPYSDEDNFLDIQKLGAELSKLVNSHIHREFLSNTKLIYEPGRYLSGRAGIYLTKILYSKTSRGKKILLTEGGIHQFLRPALIGQSHPVVNLTALYEGRSKKDTYMIAGPLCTSIDTFGENIQMADSKPGDILAILNAGAYGFSESMPYFLSHPEARQMFID